MNIMNLFSLEGNSLIISLGLTLLVSALIMFYCLRKFNLLETSIIEQGRILQTFIMRMQDKENNLQSEASTIAINSAINQVNSNKIEVSDEEYDTDESESESESENENNDTNSKQINLETSNILALETMPTYQQFGSVKVVELEDYTINEPINNILEVIDNSSDSESNITSDQNDLVETINNNEIEELQEFDTKKPIFSKLKVADLRILVNEKGLVQSMEDANKIKKDDLLKMLQSE